MNLRLEYLDPAELRANPANWRKHPEAQTAALRDVVAEVGWAGALLFNERTGNLIDGHARKGLFAGQKVPVLIGSWDEDQERKILATLDPVAAMAEADKEALAALLKDVETESEALKSMLDSLGEANGIDGGGETPVDVGPQIDRAAELQEKWGTARGQLWMMISKSVPGKSHRLLCGDSTLATDVQRVMAGEIPFLMVTDPPYGVEYAGSRRPELSRHTVSGKLLRTEQGAISNDHRSEWSQAFRGDVAYVWHGALHAHLVRQGLEDSGYEIRSQIIWKKPQAPMGRSHYWWQHEPCFYAVRKGGNAKWIGEVGSRTVWEIMSLAGWGRAHDPESNANQGHPTQKPVECMARPIRNHGGKDDHVYDPFVGCGTTIVAAEQIGRLCHGIEIEPKYVAVILERMAGLGLEPKQI